MKVLSCSNDTTIKLWKVPDPNFTHVSSFYTINQHQDYVRSMIFCKGRLFSISDDGHFAINDLDQMKIVQEFKSNQKNFGQLKGGESYVSPYQGSISHELLPGEKKDTCPTCIGASESGNMVVIGYSDDSMLLYDVRSGYKDSVRLEVGCHDDTVKTVAFSQHDGDFLCLTGGSDSKMKLWDLRQRKCIRDYGGEEDDIMIELGLFHTDSIWTIEPNSTFEQCYSGGRDGQIFHTDLVQDQHTLLYNNNKNPVSSMTFDEEYDKLWFTSSNDSSLRCLDL